MVWSTEQPLDRRDKGVMMITWSFWIIGTRIDLNDRNNRKLTFSCWLLNNKSVRARDAKIERVWVLPQMSAKIVLETRSYSTLISNFCCWWFRKDGRQFDDIAPRFRTVNEGAICWTISRSGGGRMHARASLMNWKWNVLIHASKIRM